MSQITINHRNTLGGWIGVTSETAMLPLHCRADRTRVKIGLRAPLTRFQEQDLAYTWPFKTALLLEAPAIGACCHFVPRVQVSQEEELQVLFRQQASSRSPTTFGGKAFRPSLSDYCLLFATKMIFRQKFLTNILEI